MIIRKTNVKTCSYTEGHSDYSYINTKIITESSGNEFKNLIDKMKSKLNDLKSEHIKKRQAKADEKFGNVGKNIINLVVFNYDFIQFKIKKLSIMLDNFLKDPTVIDSKDYNKYIDECKNFKAKGAKKYDLNVASLVISNEYLKAVNDSTTIMNDAKHVYSICKEYYNKYDNGREPFKKVTERLNKYYHGSNFCDSTANIYNWFVEEYLSISEDAVTSMKELDTIMKHLNKANITESATEIPDERESFTRYFNVEDVEPSIADIEDDSREEFYRDPVFNKAISEHFNILDKKTRKTLLSLDEAGQNSVVMSLTSKLYDKIVDKCEDIDYGEIPATKGDITKLSKYDSMKETISIMHDLLREYNQDTGPVDELSVAFSNVEARKDLFERAYRYNSELPIAIYCNVVLGIITGISYMIATCIEFIKDPGTENFRISLDKVAYAKSKDHMIYNTLKSFNKTCANKEFDKAMEAVLKSSTKNFGGAVAAGSIAMVVLGTILVLIPVLRELIFMFYYMRMKVSDFFDIQADLLQANAYSIEANKTLDKSEQKKIMAKQLKYVANFRKISNAFAIDMKKAEVESEKEKKSDDETKMLIDDIDGIDTGSNGSALF